MAPASLSAVSTTFVTSSSLCSHSCHPTFVCRKRSALFLRHVDILPDLPFLSPEGQ